MANYVLLDRVELNADATSVVFSNIPQSGYTDLKIVHSARTSRTNSINDTIGMRINGYTSGYYAMGGYANGSNAGSYSPNPANAGYGGTGTSSTSLANTFASTEICIPNYRTSKNRTYTVNTVAETNATTQYMEFVGSMWTANDAISTLTFLPINSTYIKSGSTFSLYGLSAVDVTPTVAPKANGGNVIATDGTYWYHAFTSSGTFTPQTPLTCDILQVAGGGGGGSSAAGGGGAGGVLAFASQSLSASEKSVVVGAGGAGTNVSSSDNADGSNGTNSQFAALTASVGGGGGASFTTSNGKNGGSGGGGVGVAGVPGGTGGSPTSGQGYAGGNGASNGYSGAGGGGAGGVGGNGSGSTAGNGGAGKDNVTNWGSLTAALTATNLGVSGGLGGGGGGGGQTTAGTASAGGGAGAAANGTATAAVANTGGGGGGARRDNNTTGQGAAGGSGVVIIRYAI